MPPDRRFRAGFIDDAQGAGARAAGDALVHDDPRSLIVFCSRAHDLGPLLSEIRERAGDVPLNSCTTAGVTVGFRSQALVLLSIG